jgi:hypothetical protein
MSRRTDIWTYLIITAITLVIWIRAAEETRVSESHTVLLQFVVTSAETWIIAPGNTASVTLTLEGSQRAVRRAKEIDKLTIELAPTVGEQAIDVRNAVAGLSELTESGTSVASATPDRLRFELDKRISVTAQVEMNVAGVETTEPPVIDPPVVTVSMPQRLLSEEPLEVETRIDRQSLERGGSFVLDNVRLRLPERFAGVPSVEVSPSAVRVSFTIRSQIRAVAPPAPVWVKILTDPEDDEIVRADPPQIRDVVLRVKDDLAARIETGEVTVVAIAYLKSSELDQKTLRKAVTFAAIGPGVFEAPLDATVDGATTPPEVTFEVTPRAPAD